MVNLFSPSAPKGEDVLGLGDLREKEKVDTLARGWPWGGTFTPTSGAQGKEEKKRKKKKSNKRFGPPLRRTREKGTLTAGDDREARQRTEKRLPGLRFSKAGRGNPSAWLEEGE